MKEKLKNIGINSNKLNQLSEDELNLLASNNGIKLINAIKEHNDDGDVNDAFDQAKAVLSKEIQEFEGVGARVNAIYEKVESIKNSYHRDGLGYEHWAQDESYDNGFFEYAGTSSDSQDNGNSDSELSGEDSSYDF